MDSSAAVNGTTSLINAQPLIPETCVSLHLFNSAPIISELFSYIANVPPPWELIAHLDIQSKDFAREKEQLSIRFPEATLIVTEDNRGADVGGKLLSIQDLLLRSPEKRCKSVLFIHSKSADWWRRILLEPLLGSQEIAERNLNIFRTKSDVGIVGSAGCKVEELGKRDFASGDIVSNLGSAEHNQWISTWTTEHMTCNHHWVVEYAQRLQQRPPKEWSDVEFVAGSIFWIRTDILMKAFGTKIESNDPLHMYMELERNYDHQDCQRAHGFERFFGWINTAAGYRFEWV